MLASYAYTRDWDRYVPSVLMAYRASPHESTGLTPNKMMFGREVDLPIDVICGQPKEGHADASDYVDGLRQRLESAHEMARIQLKKSACYQSRHYNLKADKAEYDVGGTVMARVGTKKVGLSPKLQPKWDGPYIITHLLSDVVVRMQRGPRHKPKVIHVNRLKPFYGDVDKSWLSLQRGEENGQRVEVERFIGRMEPEPLSQLSAGDNPVHGNEQAEPLSHLSAGDREDPDHEAEETELTSKTAVEDHPDHGADVEPSMSQHDAGEHSADYDDETEPQVNEKDLLGRRKRKPPTRYGEWCAHIQTTKS